MNVNVCVLFNIFYFFVFFDFGVILFCLNNFNGIVWFYFFEILLKLIFDDGYVLFDIIINVDMFDYDSVEGVLMDSNIQLFNDMVLFDIDNFNLGKQGNVFQFILSNIEFFSGMNGFGFIVKVGIVFMVIFVLGLIFFVIGLFNWKKGG